MDRQGIVDMFRALTSQSSHAELINARGKTNDPAIQARLAPLEHRAFAREFAQESPLQAAVSLPFAIPAYTMGKQMAQAPVASGSLPMMAAKWVSKNVAGQYGLDQSRSPASLAEMGHGFAGLGEGLLSRLKSFGR